jgi:hypothetical protein
VSRAGFACPSFDASIAASMLDGEAETERIVPVTAIDGGMAQPDFSFTARGSAGRPGRPGW